MAEIRGVFFDVYGKLLRYGDMKLAWAICRAMVTLLVPAKPSRQRMVFFMV